MSTDAHVDSSVPLQQIPPSPRPEEVAKQQIVPVVVIIPPSAAQEADVVDIYLVNPDEANVVPEQNVSEERIDKEIEMEKAVPSPLKKFKLNPPDPPRRVRRLRGSKLLPKEIPLRSPHLVLLPRWRLTLLLVLWLHNQNRKRKI